MLYNFSTLSLTLAARAVNSYMQHPQSSLPQVRISMPRDNFEVSDRRNANFFMVFNDLYDRFAAQLGPYGLAVYMGLCRYANRRDECWPSHGRIAADTGMSRRQVLREVAKLEALQLVEIHRRKNAPHLYILLDSCDTQSHRECDTQSHRCDSQSHKQNTKTRKSPDKVNKKEERRNYRPAEYADIILG